MNYLSTYTFENKTYNFFGDNTDKIYLTREQVGMALGYKNPSEAIRQIHKRYRQKLEQFCIRIKTPIYSSSSNNMLRSQCKNLMTETIYYSERGILEICRVSKQQKANDFVDFVFDIHDILRRNEYVFMSRNEFNQLVTQVNDITIKLQEIEKRSSKS